MKIRTRYAPSPTGFFHVGGARTALYNYLFAKHMQGTFIVRIEDTDIERNVEHGTESQLDNLQWLGIVPDESPLNPGSYGPYKQTQKLQRYEQLAMQLVNSKQAYYCFCTKEQLDQDREFAEANHQTPKYARHCLHLSSDEIQAKLDQKIPYTIRLKIDDQIDYKWNDLIRGEISIPGSAMTDPVILKSNKIAMYNFAVVIDDYDMDITHVLRGEEHISNTPYQIAIKRALKFDTKPIEYGHLSIIVNDQNKKLSKRDTTLKQFIADFQTLGYLPFAVNNFLALMGWAPSGNKEIMNMSELIANFDLKAVNKAPARYDIVKLNWISNQHFKKMTDTDYLAFVEPFVDSQNPTFINNKQETLLLLKPQLSYAGQIDELIADLFVPQATIEAETKVEIKNLHSQFSLLLPLLDQYLVQHNPQTIEDFKQMIDSLKQASQLQGKDLFMPVRILCTTKMHGPELAKMLFLLGPKLISHNVNLVRQEL